MGFRLKINFEGYETDDGLMVIYHISGEEFLRCLNTSKIRKILNETLQFGNNQQIHALKAYQAIAEYREREEQFYRKRRSD